MIDYTPIMLRAGQKVNFYGDNATYAPEGMESRFEINGQCYIYCNIISLLYKENFATATTLPRNYIFYDMFSGNENYRRPIYSHPSKDLLLPATTLTTQCYSGMFQYTCLTRASELPATTLAEQCYWVMFEGCTSLTKAPDLPATTLQEACYNAMFQGCSSLTAAPELPAPTLAQYSYQFMFSGCINLSSITCLATNMSAKHCTYSWLDGVASSGTFTKAADVDWPEGVSGIPSGWTVVEK